MLASRARLGIFTLVSLLSITQVPRASAQYMYLDSNGDGVHTAADQVNPSGPTTIDIWLDVSKNRDGTPAVCPSDGTAHTFNSYGVGLRISEGTVSWGTFTNLQPTMSVHFRRGESPTEYVDGYGGSTIHPAGLFQLGRLFMTVVSGSPSVAIVPMTTLSFEPTMFGSRCEGIDFDNTMKLGQEWHDTDGLSFGSGGGPNSPPQLAVPNDMNVATGEWASQPLLGTDADGHSLEFTMGSGPAYASVHTIDPGSGSSIGEIFAAPRTVSGTSTLSVQVSDGFQSAIQSLSITAPQGPNHEPRGTAPDMVAVAEKTATLVLVASDSDGDPVSFSKLSGPSYATVATRRAGPGGSTGELVLTPGVCDAGNAVVVVRASDGHSAHDETISIRVLEHLPAPAAATRPYVVPRFTVDVALGDLNGDGHLDAVTTTSLQGGTSAHLGDGQGNLGAPTTIANVAGSTWPISLALGDVDEDGDLDLAVANSSTLTVFLGNGNGTFGAGSSVPTGSGPLGVALVDMNRDDNLDLVVSNRGSNTIAVHPGTGTGAFEHRRESSVGTAPQGFTIADLNLDGILDVAVASGPDHSVSILLGRGNGFFAPRQDIVLNGSPVTVASGDLDADGNPDLVVPNFLTGVVHVLHGVGDGTFSPLPNGPSGIQPQQAILSDMNADGRLDLVIADTNGSYTAYGAGNGTFGTRVPMPPFSGASAGDVNEDGYLDLATIDLDNGTVYLNREGGAGGALARAFHPSNKQIVLNQGNADACIRLEPRFDSYENSEVDFSSVRWTSVGTGTVDVISAVTAKSVVVGDTDRNDVPDVPVCFKRADLRNLYAGVHGKQTVTGTLQGNLTDGKPFCAPIQIEVVGTGGSTLAASVSPNPLNPRATLRFTTSRDGAVKIRVYDLHGRVVRTLLEVPTLPAGAHEVEIDGRSQNGQTFASGIYFYEIQATEGTVRGRMTILK